MTRLHCVILYCVIVQRDWYIFSKTLSKVKISSMFTVMHLSSYGFSVIVYILKPVQIQTMAWCFLACYIKLTNIHCKLNQIIALIINRLCNHPCLYFIRKSKDYVYGIWVYKALGIWKGYYRVKKSLVSYVKPWTGARNNKYMKYQSKLTYQLSFWNVSRKENQLLSLKHPCWLSLV